ncbi:extracellular calcium-sensing receptor-like [Xenopus tropicalis]|uniref:Extracellular calcium-sensing receptor-like n=1 Tax=Xenopus tropicalis TaxID=8364 RepID=A0A8J1J8D9_XENTR|nr:extracellular calcium-sensing receptor-like [Xenopus tropicalis]
MEGMFQPGDILLGVVLPLHLDKEYHPVSFSERPPRINCTTFHLENFQQLQAMMFAVKEINTNPNILPNISLGFQAYDSCDVLQQDLEGTLQVLSGRNGAIPNYRCIENMPLSGVIGASISTHSILLAHILGLYRYPQVSHYSTSPILSNQKMFPSFFRTVPSDAFQSQGLAKLVLHFGWTWVGLLAVDNDYGQQGIQLVKQEIIKAGACVAFTESILTSQPDRNARNIVKVMKESTATAIVVFSPAIDLVHVLAEMLAQNVTEKILVASEAWSTSTLFSDGKFSEILSGTIGLALHSGKIPGFREFLNKVHPSTSLGKYWVKLLWEESFQCKFLGEKNPTATSEDLRRECTGEETLASIENNYNDVSSLRATYNVYTAVHVMAKALEDLTNCNKGRSRLSNQTCPDILNFKPWQLLHYVKKVRVTLSSGRELFFDKNGDPPAVYDIVNWKGTPNGTIKQVNVGSYDTAASFGQVFTLNKSAISWPAGKLQVPLSVCSQSCPLGFRKTSERGKPACCFQCIPCPQGEISNITDSIDCFKCLWDEWPNGHKTRCMQKNIEFLSYEDPLGAGLAATGITSSLVPVVILKLFMKYKTTPIVKANNYSLSCILLSCLPLCFLCSLAFIGYPQQEKCLLRQAAFGLVFALCVSCILAKTVMVVFAFMATKPGSRLRKWTSPIVSYMIIAICFALQCILCISWLLQAPPFPQYDIQTKPGVIIIECNNGSATAFWCMLGYLGFLAAISFSVAFLARRLPDNFNEAKFITFSMLAFLSVWVSFIPASLSAQGKYTEAMEIFAILSSSWALVVCMFFPKCYIIKFKPNMNSKKQLMKKAGSQI